jgi:hypothetical protein
MVLLQGREHNGSFIQYLLPLHPNASDDLNYIEFNMHSDYNEGWCIACGTEHQGIERFTTSDVCNHCQEPLVYGSFALMERLTGIAVPPDTPAPWDFA